MLLVVFQQKGKINNTKPIPINKNNNMASPHQTDPGHVNPLNNNNNTASPHQTDPGPVLARANRKCTPKQVTINKQGVGQTMKVEKRKPRRTKLEITFNTHIVCRSERREKNKENTHEKKRKPTKQHQKKKTKIDIPKLDQYITRPEK